ncbi:MAG: DUF192 domain-containing protein [Bacteriovoracaceae bacterium]|nr:DUF192 domain-containing protein [Bacteriovoracaceae bacterium]
MSEMNEMWLIAKKNSGEMLLPKIKLANSFFDRLRGYMFYKTSPYAAILLSPAQSIHTFFMNFSIHVICLDKKNRVTKVHEHVPPRRIIFWDFKYHKVLEIPCERGDKCMVKKGDILIFEETCID